ncbi:hypothetical protein [Bacillus sp. FJAT-45037]|uniref:UPF0738 family protein n=1 Tax=Bacillus sp. FJAT-45037 TaxID=2011007 RepID=UPI000C24C932|nr:hypothetical protein [Bacillus sp. FJAT-45037]
MQKINVTEMKKEPQQYIVACSHALNQESVSQIKAGERMLVDSDGLAFIYILEDDTQFYYLTFGKDSWQDLREAYESEIPVYAELTTDHQIELTALGTELDFLLENIDGNSNYGEELEANVQEVFKRNVE